MSVQYREDRGNWRVRWREDGKMKSRTFATEEEAVQFDDMIVGVLAGGGRGAAHDVRRPDRVPMPDSWFEEITPDVPTFGVFAREWFDRQHFRAQSTRSGKLAALRTTQPIDDVRLDELKVSDIETWFKSLYESGLSDGSVRTYWRIVRQVYNAALADDVIKRDRLRGVKSPKSAGRKSIAHHVSPEQARAIMDSVPEQYAAVFGCEYLTGMRWSEVAAITTDSVRIWVTPDRHDSIDNVDDVTGLEGFIDVDAHLAAEGIKEATKTGTSRQVPIDEHTVRMLHDHLADHGTGDGGLVFHSSRGTPLHSSNWSRDVTPLAREAAGSQFTGHDLRHTVAHDIEVIAGTKVAADLLGHSVQGSMTLSYTFVDTSAVAEAVRVRGEQVAGVLFGVDVELEEVAV